MAHSQTNKNSASCRSLSVGRKAVREASRPATLYFINQKGSALIIGMSLMPLLVGGMFASLALAWFVSAKNDLLFECENGVLKSQKILVEAENTLLRLNTPVTNLVTQKKLLQRALLLAKTPVEISMIKARLLIIESQLTMLRKQQTAIHTLADAQASRSLQITALRLKQAFHRLQSLWSAQLFPSSFATTALIRLQKIAIDPSAQIYEAGANFPQQQTLTVSAKLSGPSLFPTWIAFLHSETFSWQESCSSRPALKENLWTAEIGKGKF
jgi:hypothetical protein